MPHTIEMTDLESVGIDQIVEGLREPVSTPKVDPAKPADDAKAKTTDKPAAASAAPTGDDSDDDDQGDDDATVDANASAAGQALAKKKKSLQSRIDEAKFREYATARERDEARERISQLETELAALKNPTAPKADEKPVAKAKPKMSDFDDLDVWAEAVAEWAEARATTAARTIAEEAQAKAAAANQQQTAAQQRAAQREKFEGTLAAARTAHPDFDEVLSASSLEFPKDPSGQNLPHPVQVDLEHSELGGELIYHFASHPDEFHELLAQPRAIQLKRIGRLEAQLEKTSSTPQVPAASTTVPAAPVVPVSKASPPLKTVGISPQATSDDDGDEDAVLERNLAKRRKAR